ncbi:hypothetical protein PENSPDRAFT_692631 [Peniophora sp. CONT]|nr:hypothetical protein PENSPDRAFT_692631 [Peniophora sp. CONT]
MPSPVRSFPAEVVAIILQDLDIFDLFAVMRVDRAFRLFIRTSIQFRAHVSFFTALMRAGYCLGGNKYNEGELEHMADVFFHLRASRSAGLGGRSYGAYLTHVVEGRTLIRVRDCQWLVSLTLTPATTTTGEADDAPLMSTIYRAPMPITLDTDEDLDLYNDAFTSQDVILHNPDRVLAFNVSLQSRILVAVQLDSDNAVYLRIANIPEERTLAPVTQADDEDGAVAPDAEVPSAASNAVLQVASSDASADDAPVSDADPVSDTIPAVDADASSDTVTALDVQAASDSNPDAHAVSSMSFVPDAGVGAISPSNSASDIAITSVADGAPVPTSAGEADPDPDPGVTKDDHDIGDTSDDGGEDQSEVDGEGDADSDDESGSESGSGGEIEDEDDTLDMPWASAPEDYAAAKLEILDAYAAILLQEPWRFLVYDWKDRRMLWSPAASPSDGAKQIAGFTFLPSRSLLLLEQGASGGAMRLYRIPDLGSGTAFSTPNVRLELPPLAPTARYVRLELHSSVGSGGMSSELISNGRVCVVVCSIHRAGYGSISQFALFFLAKTMDAILKKSGVIPPDGFSLPWGLWGPATCRFLDLGPEIKVFPNAICGLRVVVRQRLNGGAGTWPAIYRNIYFDFGDHLASLSGMGTLPNSASVKRGTVRNETSVFQNGAFTQPIYSSLPFSFTCDDPREYTEMSACPELFMDDSKLLQMFVNDPEGLIFDFEVYDF